MLIRTMDSSYIIVIIGQEKNRFAVEPADKASDNPMTSSSILAEAWRLLFRENNPVACMKLLGVCEPERLDSGMIETAALAHISLRQPDFAIDEIVEAVKRRRRALREALLAREGGKDAAGARDAEVEARRGLVHALLAQALIHWLDNGNVKEALARLNEAAETLPSEPAAYVNRMVIHADQGRYDLIERELETMDEKVPDWRSEGALRKAMLVVLPELEEKVSTPSGRHRR